MTRDDDVPTGARPTLRIKVLDHLRAAIVSGELPPGTLHSARTLGVRFGVSATPIREAMTELGRRGLVEVVPNKGFRIVEPTQEQLDEVAELRLLVEPFAGRSAAHRVDGDDTKRLRSTAERCVEAAEQGALLEFLEADRRFHLDLVALSGYPLLVQVVDDFRSRTKLPGLRTLAEGGALVPSAMEHLTVVDALERRDADTVEALVRLHIGHTKGLWRAGKHPR